MLSIYYVYIENADEYKTFNDTLKGYLYRCASKIFGAWNTKEILIIKILLRE